jgi:hypothetical protein
MSVPIEAIRRAINEARNYCDDYGTINDSHLRDVEMWLDRRAVNEEWIDGNIAVPPLIDDTDNDSEWVEVRAQAYWYSDGHEDFGWLIAQDTIKWRPLPAQGEGTE